MMRERTICIELSYFQLDVLISKISNWVLKVHIDTLRELLDSFLIIFHCVSLVSFILDLPQFDIDITQIDLWWIFNCFVYSGQCLRSFLIWRLKLFHSSEVFFSLVKFLKNFVTVTTTLISLGKDRWIGYIRCSLNDLCAVLYFFLSALSLFIA